MKQKEVERIQEPEDTGNEIQRYAPNEDPIELAELRLERVKRFVALSLQVTNEKDWTEIDGEPYLRATGAEKVARLFGVSWTQPDVKCVDEEDANGKYYIYTAAADFFLSGRPGESIGVMGRCSSRDKFFGTKDGKAKETADVSKENIMAKAMNNMINNGIKRLIGLRNVSWEMFLAAKLDRSKMSSVRHQSGGQGGTSKAKASANQVERVTQYLKALRPGDSAAQAKLYHEIADFDGKDGRVVAKAPEKLSEKWLGGIVRKLEELAAQEGISLEAPPPRQPGEDEGSPTEDNGNDGNLPI